MRSRLQPATPRASYANFVSCRFGINGGVRGALTWGAITLRPTGSTSACLALAVVLLIGPLLPALRKKREIVALDEGV
jgi:hypothetical protein